MRRRWHAGVSRAVWRGSGRAAAALALEVDDLERALHLAQGAVLGQCLPRVEHAGLGLLGGAVGVVGHLEICDKVVITGKSVVRNSITEPGEYSSGTPLTDNRTWRKNAARFKQLDALARRVLAAGKEKE